MYEDEYESEYEDDFDEDDFEFELNYILLCFRLYPFLFFRTY